jgi:hypothetical protein
VFSNRLSGPLPGAWSGMAALEELALYNNTLTGVLGTEEWMASCPVGTVLTRPSWQLEQTRAPPACGHMQVQLCVWLMHNARWTSSSAVAPGLATAAPPWRDLWQRPLPHCTPAMLARVSTPCTALATPLAEWAMYMLAMQ